MLFVTNRRLLGGARSKAGRPITFDLTDNDPSASLFFCARQLANGYQELMAPSFLQRLRQSTRQQILLYLHGYNSQPEPAIFPNALQLQELCDAAAPGMVEVVPLIWPCSDMFGILRDYWDDQAAADMSGVAFARFIGKFLDWRDRIDAAERCPKHVNILAHSMGARVLRVAIQRWRHDYGAAPSFFRNLFLVAADIANDSLEEGTAGAVLAESTRNLLVYHAPDDLALRSSKVVNLRNKVVGRRLGHSGPRDLAKTARNVFSIDCDAFNAEGDIFGHSYFLADRNGRPSPVLQHIIETMRTGRPPRLSAERRDLVLGEAGLVPA